MRNLFFILLLGIALLSCESKNTSNNSFTIIKKFQINKDSFNQGITLNTDKYTVTYVCDRGSGTIGDSCLVESIAGVFNYCLNANKVFIVADREDNKQLSLYEETILNKDKYPYVIRKVYNTNGDSVSVEYKRMLIDSMNNYKSIYDKRINAFVPVLQNKIN